MKRSGKWRGSDPYQLTIDWNAKPAAGIPAAAIPPMPAPSPKLRLKWDFCTTFPHPTEQAIEAGLIQPEDVDLESIRSIHEEHARELRNTLDDLDAVRSAQRRGVDPASGHPPKTAASRLRLQKLYESEPKRCAHGMQACWSRRVRTQPQYQQRRQPQKCRSLPGRSRIVNAVALSHVCRCPSPCPRP
jgi:hypothetical protein